MKTEKDIDNLFKQSLDDPGNYPNYREGDWNALEAMLDKRKKRAIVFWLPLLSGIAATVIVAMGWLFTRPATDGKTKTTPIATTVVKHNPVQTGSSGLAAKKIDRDINGTPGTSGRQIQQQVVLNKKFRLPVNPTNTPAGTTNKSFLTLSAVDAGRNITGTDDDNINAASRQSETLTVLAANTFPEGKLNTDMAFSAKRVNTNKTLSAPKRDIKVSGFHPQYALTVLASSNLNGVGTLSNSQAGANAGLLFSVGVSKKFTISTGAVYAKTPYTTDFYNYHTAYQFKNDPVNVAADCRILDIPINVDYKFARSGRNSFSVGSGLSSYIMLRENYHYNYAPGSKGYYGMAPTPTDFDIANKNRYFLGVLNLDATYQRQVNAKFAFSVQPYLKLPLTDIGNGGVSLQTTGVSVGFSWNINSQKH